MSKIRVVTAVSENHYFPLTDQQEKYLLIIFESVPTVVEEATLEEILIEMGRLKNLSNFLIRLTCEEATDRLMAHTDSQKVSWKWELAAFFEGNCKNFRQFVNLEDIDNRRIIYSISLFFVLGLKVILVSFLSHFSLPKSEVTTLSVSDSEEDNDDDDDDDLMILPSSYTQIAQTWVVLVDLITLICF